MYVQCNTDLSLDLCVPICAINLYYPNSNNSTHLFWKQSVTTNSHCLHTFIPVRIQRTNIRSLEATYRNKILFMRSCGWTYGRDSSIF